MKSIREMQIHDRPREKLKNKGVIALSDQDLVAAILGSGNSQANVRVIAQRVLAVIREQKHGLSLDHLCAIPGMGMAKASQILAAFEIARRHLSHDTVRITCAKDIVPLLQDISDKQQEYFVCISLNGANEVIQKRIVTIGLLDRSQVHPREVFADPIADRAATVILAHNHPSGKLTPSAADKALHEQLVSSGALLGIPVLDHLIVSKKGYYSFSEP